MLIVNPFSLPAGLRHAGQQALERQTSEAEAAHVELAHERARTAAERAPVAVPDPELRLVLQLF